MSDLVGEFLSRSDATVEVETTLFPRMTFKLGDVYTSEQGWLTKFLRPRVTLRAAGVTKAVEPAGPPEVGPPWGMISVLTVAALAVFAWRGLR